MSGRKTCLTETAQYCGMGDLLRCKECTGSRRMPLSLAFGSYGCQIRTNLYSMEIWLAPLEMAVGLDVVGRNGA